MSPEPVLDIDLARELPGFALRVRSRLPLAGVTGLTGPSGSGKSSLLRLIAGFDAGRGHVRVGDETWADSAAGRCLPPHRRAVGYVFQDARLFPHLDVAGNLRYADRRRRGDGPGYADVVAALDLGPLAGRDVATLSGGERQRVALGRTLLTGPRLLLLDEPLASLDAARKAEILPYLETLSARFGLPLIYVSHALDEIIRLADRVLVLEAGSLRAAGDTAAVVNELAAPATGPLFDTPSVLETRVLRHLPDLHLTEVAFDGQSLFVPRLAAREPGDRLRLRVRAGDVALATSEPHNLSVRNVLRGRLVDIATLPDSAFALAVVDVGGARLRCHLTRQAVRDLELVAGMPVHALLKTAAFEAYG